MDRGEVTEVLRDVRVFSVTLVGDGLVVDVYGGSHSVVSSLVYKDIPTTSELLDLSQVFQRWELEATPLQYVRFRSGEVCLVPVRDGSQ